MPQFLDALHRVGAWNEAHPWISGVTTGLLIFGFGFLAARHFRNIVANLVIRRLFGSTHLPTPAESAQRIARAEAEAANAISAVSMNVQTGLRAIATQVRNREIPFTLAVNAPEERQTLEALIARSVSVAPVVVSSQGQGRGRKRPNENREEVPTAWARLLVDEDEEGTPCPMIPTPPTEPPAPKATKKKSPKPKAPKKTKG